MRAKSQKSAKRIIDRLDFGLAAIDASENDVELAGVGAGADPPSRQSATDSEIDTVRSRVEDLIVTAARDVANARCSVVRARWVTNASVISCIVVGLSTMGLLFYSPPTSILDGVSKGGPGALIVSCLTLALNWSFKLLASLRLDEAFHSRVL